MKLPYNTQLFSTSGQPMISAAEVKDKDTGEIITPAKPYTLKTAILSAFDAVHAADEKMSRSDRYAMGKLAYAVGSEQDLTVEEVAKVKERIGDLMMPVIVFSAWNLIEQAAKPAAEEVTL